MSVVSKEQAIREVNQWLDYKKVRPSRRKERNSDIEGLVECFEEGVLALNEETHEITQKLLFPVDNVDELVFKPRMNGAQFKKYSNKLSSGDTQGFVTAKIAALTGQNSGIIDGLDQEDLNIANYIAIFFV